MLYTDIELHTLVGSELLFIRKGFVNNAENKLFHGTHYFNQVFFF
jgi:hypothetical protein